MTGDLVEWLRGRPSMTLGEATGWLRSEPIACACIGGEWCCVRQYERAQALQRAAHIVVKLLDAFADGSALEGVEPR